MREMASKALAALVPLRSVPVKISILISQLNLTLSDSKPHHNTLHGTLCLIYELLDNLKRRMTDIGDNRALFSCIQVEIVQYVLPQLAELLSKLSTLICPVLHIVYLRIVRSTNTILSTLTDEVYHSCDISQALVIGECRVILGSVLTSVLVKEIFPFESVTYREAMTDIVFLSIEYESHSQVVEGLFILSDLYLISLPFSILSIICGDISIKIIRFLSISFVIT